jgi:hypothetical protein
MEKQKTNVECANQTSMGLLKMELEMRGEWA